MIEFYNDDTEDARSFYYQEKLGLNTKVKDDLVKIENLVGGYLTGI